MSYYKNDSESGPTIAFSSLFSSRSVLISIYLTQKEKGNTCCLYSSVLFSSAPQSCSFYCPDMGNSLFPPSVGSLLQWPFSYASCFLSFLCPAHIDVVLPVSILSLADLSSAASLSCSYRCCLACIDIKFSRPIFCCIVVLLIPMLSSVSILSLSHLNGKATYHNTLVISLLNYKPSLTNCRQWM